MTDNTEDRPNTYLDEARKFKAAQENANALEVQKLINMLDAASEAVRKHEAMLARLRTEIAYINEALGCLGATVQIGLGEPHNTEMIADEDAPMPADRQAKVVEGPLPEHPPMTPGEQKRAQAETEAFINLVRKALQVNGGSIRSFLVTEVPALVAHIADGNFVVTNDAVQAALAILHQRKHVRWVKNGRVLLARRR